MLQHDESFISFFSLNTDVYAPLLAAGSAAPLPIRPRHGSNPLSWLNILLEAWQQHLALLHNQGDANKDVKIKNPPLSLPQLRSPVAASGMHHIFEDTVS
uniref:Uncharacterized protein n=1 Tax=Junco hyemalis TaxID=40217 RepID=A0A8C5NJW7_JUNHY